MDNLMNARDILNREYPETTSLWGPFIEIGDLNGLIGGSDSGKSSFLRALALAIVKGEETFLNFPLNVKHNRVLIVSIEDGELAVGRVFQRFYKEDPEDERMERLMFLFEYEGKLDVLLDELCHKHKLDLIILDCYSDAFDGKSGNDQMETKQFLRRYDTIAKAHGVAILFLHHLNKAGDEGRVSKRDVMGSAAFEQKLRCVLSLNTRDKGSNIRVLTVAKANYVSTKIKTQEFHLEFEEETMSFKFLQAKMIAPKAEDSTSQKKAMAAYAINELKVGTREGATFIEAAEKVGEKFSTKLSHGTLHNYVQKYRDEIRDNDSDRPTEDVPGG